jgi:hypothetical protein
MIEFRAGLWSSADLTARRPAATSVGALVSRDHRVERGSQHHGQHFSNKSLDVRRRSSIRAGYARAAAGRLCDVSECRLFIHREVLQNSEVFGCSLLAGTCPCRMRRDRRFVLLKRQRPALRSVWGIVTSPQKTLCSTGRFGLEPSLAAGGHHRRIEGTCCPRPSNSECHVI